MNLAVSSIVGLECVPSTPRGARDWLKRHGVPLSQDGKRLMFQLCDLPESVRHAYQARIAERSGLAAGVQDDAAHLALMAKPMGVQTDLLP